MIERIIMSFSCFLCASAFFMISYVGKMRNDPMSFWTGDDSLKDKVRDVKSYNREMVKLYNRYGFCFLAAAVGGAIRPEFGFGILIADCTVGVYLVYRRYKQILAKYS